MATIVLKFGGAAVSAPEQFASIAQIIKDRRARYPRVVVAVSAMGNTTDDLIALAKRVHPTPPRRELDMLLTVGERISMSLLAMALDLEGIPARSFTGSQSGILTTPDHSEARIVEVRPQRLLPHLDAGRVVIVAGFQGMSTHGEITTLGRGGTDTTAVALGVALRAEGVEFFKDVRGIFDSDPKRNPGAKLHAALSYDEALAIMKGGAQVLHDRCVELAKANALPLRVLPFEDFANPDHGTRIGPTESDCAVAAAHAGPCYEVQRD